VIQRLDSMSSAVALDSLRAADGAAPPCCAIDSAGAPVTIKLQAVALGY
jgi:hypothetical protein